MSFCLDKLRNFFFCKNQDRGKKSFFRTVNRSSILFRRFSNNHAAPKLTTLILLYSKSLYFGEMNSIEGILKVHSHWRRRAESGNYVAAFPRYFHAIYYERKSSKISTSSALPRRNFRGGFSSSYFYSAIFIKIKAAVIQ